MYSLFTPCTIVCKNEVFKSFLAFLGIIITPIRKNWSLAKPINLNQSIPQSPLLFSTLYTIFLTFARVFSKLCKTCSFSQFLPAVFGKCPQKQRNCIR